MSGEELRRVSLVRKALSDRRPAEALDTLIQRLQRTKSNAEFLMGLAR